MTKSPLSPYIPISTIDSVRPPLVTDFGAIGTRRPIRSMTNSGYNYDLTEGIRHQAQPNINISGHHGTQIIGDMNPQHCWYNQRKIPHPALNTLQGQLAQNNHRQNHETLPMRDHISPPPGLTHPALLNHGGFAGAQMVHNSYAAKQLEMTQASSTPNTTWSNTGSSSSTISPLATNPQHAVTNGYQDSNGRIHAHALSPTVCSESDSEDDDSGTHPNKYPVEIEEHFSKSCGYRRQPTRSGPKIKHRNVTIYDAITLETKTEQQQIKYYQKDMVRMCRCGQYQQMDGALQHGRSNDCDGYEIHYSQKCKWKAYDDYKTGKRVLIRLCKCYKPSL